MIPVLLLFKFVVVGTSAYTGARIYQENQTVTQLKPPPLQLPSPPLEPDSPEESTNPAIPIDPPPLQEINRNLVISSTSLGLATLGALVYPPLSLLSIPGVLWIGWPVFKQAYHSAVDKHQLDISIIDTLFFTGLLATGNYFALSFAVFGLVGGQKILYHTEDHSKQNLLNLFQLPKQHAVWLWQNEVEIETTYEHLTVGDIIILNAGEIIPVDGTIVMGTASIDQHLLTGESQPVEKLVGEPVFALTVLLAGKIYVRVDKASTDTIAAQIGQILTHTTDFKQFLQSKGERMADQSAEPVLWLSAATLPVMGTTSAVTIMNSCFGLYLRVLAPLNMLTHLNLTSQAGILIKDGRSLELLKQVNTIIFDKTGTLTLEQPHLAHIYPCPGFSETELLTLAATAEHRQTHPLAKAIRQAALERGLSYAEHEEAQYEISYGVKAMINSMTVRVGSQRFIELAGIEIPAEISTHQHVGNEQGYSFVYVAVDQHLGGLLELHPTIRPEAKTIIAQLKQRGMKTYIISGDHEPPTKQLTQELGIEHYFANTLPNDKAKLVEQLQQQGHFVCFVGDGINDAIALKRANVSISLHGASTVAIDTAQIILMDQTLNQLINVFNIAEQFDTRMKVNTLATIVPGLITVAGVMFFHFSIVDSILLNQLGLATGTLTSTLPLLGKSKLTATGGGNASPSVPLPSTPPHKIVPQTRIF